MIEKILNGFKQIPSVEAIAIGGSRSTNNFDEKSDYDIYLYCTEPIDEKVRYDIYKDTTKIMEIKNHYWEEEDNIVMLDGIFADIIYRNLDDFINEIKSVVAECIPHNSYTTCMWHNLLNSKVIFDRTGRYTNYQKEFNIPYPEKLSKNIIERSHNLLNKALPNYYDQILKAIKRNDLVSINHRVSEFLASYFDLIFALNKRTHPGEKRLIKYVTTTCSILPNNFEENLNKLFTRMYSDRNNLIKVLDEIILEIEKLI